MCWEVIGVQFCCVFSVVSLTSVACVFEVCGECFAK